MNNDYYKINTEKSKTKTLVFKEKDDNLNSVIDYLNSGTNLKVVTNGKKISLSKSIPKSSVPLKTPIFQDHPELDTKPKKIIPKSPFGIGSTVVITVGLILLILSGASLSSVIFLISVALITCIKYSIDLVSCALNKDISIKRFFKRFIAFLLVIGIVAITLISAFMGMR